MLTPQQVDALWAGQEPRRSITVRGVTGRFALNGSYQLKWLPDFKLWASGVIAGQWYYALLDEGGQWVCELIGADQKPVAKWQGPKHSGELHPHFQRAGWQVTRSMVTVT